MELLSVPLRLQVLPAKNRPGWKDMSDTNFLAFLIFSLVNYKEKISTTRTPLVNVIKTFLFNTEKEAKISFSIGPWQALPS